MGTCSQCIGEASDDELVCDACQKDAWEEAEGAGRRGALAEFHEHVRNMCTWSTSQDEMQKNILAWIDSRRVPPQATEKER